MPRLTAEQRAMRANGLGGSELGIVADLNPYRSKLGLWLTKATPSRGPLLLEDQSEESENAALGHALEPALRGLYTDRTGIELEESGTLVHPTIPWLFATPDGLATKHDRGAEIKLVGSRMAHHWAEDQIPDYVIAQAAAGMAVTNRGAWDVVALIGGTDFRIATVARDFELEDLLLEEAETFWTTYVLGDTPPPPRNADEAREYLLRRYPGSSATKCEEELDEDGSIRSIVDRWNQARAEAARLQEVADELSNSLCERVGNRYGMDGKWGKWIWPKIQGRVNWKCVAEAMGPVPVALIEAHRGEPFRTPRYYPFNEKKSRKGSKQT